MSDLSITAANVLKVSGTTKQGTAGAGINAGQALYKDAAAGTIKLGDSDGAAGLRECVGLALNSPASGQPVAFISEGVISVGAVLTAGKVYVLSDTPGGIMPVEDLETGDYVTIVGVALSTSQLAVKIWNTGAVL